LVAELAAGWAHIQRYHPELPDLAAPEALIRETTSVCGASLSFERLLHEAAHGIAAVRGIRDTSRAGRYHNRRFLTVALELGLEELGLPPGKNGFTHVRLRDDTRSRYSSSIDRVEEALRDHISTSPEVFRGPATRTAPSGGGYRVKAVCACGRNIRVVLSVLGKAPIMCGACDEPFLAAQSAPA
jgi:hypothetical protein